MLELRHLHGPVKKKPKCTQTKEIVALISLNTKQKQTHALRVLVDTGASASVIIGEYHCTKLKMKSSLTTTWSTKAGTFTTTRKADYALF